MHTHTRHWRIMARWTAGDDFLIVLGDNRPDCVRRLTQAMRSYTPADLARITAAWFEQLVYDRDEACWTWQPIEVLPLRFLRGPNRRPTKLIESWERATAPQLNKRPRSLTAQ